LELPRMTAQAARMWNRLRPLLEPMNIAAYVAWLAIGSELWSGTPRGTGMIDAPLLWPVLIALHASFLALFVLRALIDAGLRQTRLLVAGQFVVALLVIAL